MLFPFSLNPQHYCVTSCMKNWMNFFSFPPNEHTHKRAKHQVCHNQSMSNATYEIIQFE